ncbi:MAG: cell envelope integrity protein TolA [Panacagrimonas sp.]
MLFRSRHVLSAAALHGLLFAFLVFSVQCSRKQEPPPVIEALVITGKNKEGKLKTEPPPPPVEEPTPEPPTPEPPPPEPPPPEPPKPEPPKPEPPKPDPEVEKRKEEAERVKREIEIKRQAEIQRKKEEDDRKKKEEQDAKRKAEEEEKKRIQEEKRKAEEERKRKEEERKRLQEEFERSLNEETEARAEAARIGEVQRRWQDILNDHIGSRWLRPPGLPPGLRCTVQIDILPNGEVISVKIVRSSGNPSFDASVENAVYKASPMPLPEDPKAFERSLQPTFTPESLSQY